MSLSTTTNKVIYNGNASATTFSYTFPIPVASYLSVIYTDADGVETTLSSSLYSVTGIGTTTGGTVTYPLTGSPIATGTKLTLLRTVPYTQDTVFSNQGGYYPEVTESRFDRAYMALQQLLELIQRAFVAPVSDGTNPTTMPSSTQRANSGAGSFLAFDSLGNPYAAALTALSGVSTWIANNLLPAASASAARTALGIGSINITPGGRLTLVATSAGVSTPVMTSAQTGKTLVYYTPYAHDLVPIWNGTSFVPTSFAELSNDLTASSTGKAGPAACTTNSNYDFFVWSDSGTTRLTRGPAWTSDTARGTGAGTTQISRSANGILTNAVAITNGPAAGYGTYVGTIRTDGSSQANWQPGAVAVNGTAALLNVWNMYNRVLCRGMIGDNTDSWTYSPTTIRAANNSSTMRVSFIMGQQEDSFLAAYCAMGANGAGQFSIGVGVDVTNAFSGRAPKGGNSAGNHNICGQVEQQLLGFHFMSACEQSDTSSSTFYGDNGGTVQNSGLHYEGRF